MQKKISINTRGTIFPRVNYFLHSSKNTEICYFAKLRVRTLEKDLYNFSIYRRKRRHVVFVGEIKFRKRWSTKVAHQPRPEEEGEFIDRWLARGQRGNRNPRGAGSRRSFRYSFVRENVRPVHVDIRRDDVARLLKEYRGKPRGIRGKESPKKPPLWRATVPADVVLYCRAQEANATAKQRNPFIHRAFKADFTECWRVTTTGQADQGIAFSEEIYWIIGNRAELFRQLWNQNFFRAQKKEIARYFLLSANRKRIKSLHAKLIEGNWSLKFFLKLVDFNQCSLLCRKIYRVALNALHSNDSNNRKQYRLKKHGVWMSIMNKKNI